MRISSCQLTLYVYSNSPRALRVENIGNDDIDGKMIMKAFIEMTVIVVITIALLQTRTLMILVMEYINYINYVNNRS